MKYSDKNICLQNGDLGESLQKISFTHLADVYQLLELLWSPETSRSKLVIIDSLATLFLPLQGDSFNDGTYFKHWLVKCH